MGIVKAGPETCLIAGMLGDNLVNVDANAEGNSRVLDHEGSPEVETNVLAKVALSKLSGVKKTLTIAYSALAEQDSLLENSNLLDGVLGDIEVDLLSGNAEPVKQ